ncbi:MAG: hypothetical protein EA397_18910 [Deltaproteobacteria bacterium]|nr:MAG: hypothetical protein EA397_18910 [Deltaproteobacteria bacterium]
MSDELEQSASPSDSSGRKRRRRRRRRRDKKSRPPEDHNHSPNSGQGEPSKRKGRRASVDLGGAIASVPASGRNPHKRRNSRARRSSPGNVTTRRRRLSKSEAREARAWLERMPDSLLGTLYKGLGGQPGRVGSQERLVDLTVKALAQGGRLVGLIKSLHERDRKAISALLQCGGIAHNEELLRELMLSYGGHEREWTKTMNVLAEKGVVFSAANTSSQFFYVVPEPLIDGLVAALGNDLSLPTFEHEDMRITESRPFCPPLEFTLTSLSTYIDQVSPRLTQRQEIYRADKEEMDAFFSQLWEPESELFSFHLDFLMMHGMVELRGEYLALNRDVVEEWLQLEPEDQRDLIFRALDRRFDMAEWVLWAVHAGEGEWVPERPLATLYRRWKRGEDWRQRLQRGQTQSARSSDRDSYSFAPLVRIGLLELGQWGQEKFYRLSPRGKQLLEPAVDDGFRQFYLTPAFEIMAPAGLAPVMLFRIGELAELTGCDRANTYRITETTIERALSRGWRRDDVLQFLRDNSQIGLPENVEKTLKGWIGHRGDVEFHDLTLLTVHRSQIRRLESNKRLKPYLLHRFAPGMYAIDRRRRDEVAKVLADSGFDPSPDVRGYPGDPEQVEARQRLSRLVTEAREDALGPSSRSGTSLVEPDALNPVPGTRSAARAERTSDQPPKVEPAEARTIIEAAMVASQDLDMVYRARTGQSLTCRIQPQRLAFKADAPVLVGLDRETQERRTFMLARIERLRAVES